MSLKRKIRNVLLNLKVHAGKDPEEFSGTQYDEILAKSQRLYNELLQWREQNQV